MLVEVSKRMIVHAFKASATSRLPPTLPIRPPNSAGCALGPPKPLASHESWPRNRFPPPTFHVDKGRPPSTSTDFFYRSLQFPFEGIRCPSFRDHSLSTISHPFVSSGARPSFPSMEVWSLLTFLSAPRPPFFIFQLDAPLDAKPLPRAFIDLPFVIYPLLRPIEALCFIQR